MTTTPYVSIAIAPAEIIFACMSDPPYLEEVKRALVKHGKPIGDAFFYIMVDYNRPLSIINLLAEFGENVKYVNPNDGSTCLFVAKSAEMITRLVELGLSPNDKDSMGRTVAHSMIQRGVMTLEMMEALKYCGAKFDIPNAVGNTVLHILASQPNKTHLLKVALSPSIINARDAQGFTPLHEACQKCAFSNVVALVDNKACLDARCTLDGTTPLMLAMASDLRIAEYLLIRGANPLLLDKNGLGPIHHAARALKSPHYIYLLRRFSHTAIHLSTLDGKSPLHYAVVHSTPQVIRTYVQNFNVAVNVRDKNGETPLHIACREKAPIENIQCLMELGATSNNKSNLGFTEYDVAVHEKYKKAIKLIRPPKKRSSAGTGGEEEEEVHEDDVPKRDEEACVVCMERLPQIICVPCGHLCLCLTCHDKMGSTSNCIICKQEAKYIKIFRTLLL